MVSPKAVYNFWIRSQSLWDILAEKVHHVFFLFSVRRPFSTTTKFQDLLGITREDSRYNIISKLKLFHKLLLDSKLARLFLRHPGAHCVSSDDVITLFCNTLGALPPCSLSRTRRSNNNKILDRQPVGPSCLPQFGDCEAWTHATVGSVLLTPFPRQLAFPPLRSTYILHRNNHEKYINISLLVGEEKYVCFYLLILVKIVFFTQMSCVGSQGHKITNNFFEEESAIFCRYTLVCFSLVNSKLILVH